MTLLTDLLRDPAWFPASIDVGADTIRFARASREALSSEAFLDQRMAGSVTAWQTAGLNETVAALAGRREPVPAFIFHTAFCCSTLLARALDVPGAVLALKEPDVLMGLANALRVDAPTRESPERREALIRSIVTLLGRRFDQGERILVKPTNAANNLLPHALATGARVVLLYGDLRSFLVSVLKKGEACKAFVRQQYNIFALDANGVGRIPQRQAVAFTDLQAAAAVWRHQMELFQRASADSQAGQVLSLDFNTLTDNPAPTMRAVVAHLNLQHSDAAVDAIAEGSVFKRNAKFSDQAYSSDQRDREQQLVEERYGETLDVIETWASQLNLGTSLQMPWPGALRV